MEKLKNFLISWIPEKGQLKWNGGSNTYYASKHVALFFRLNLPLVNTKLQNWTQQKRYPEKTIPAIFEVMSSISFSTATTTSLSAFFSSFSLFSSFPSFFTPCVCCVYFTHTYVHENRCSSIVHTETSKLNLNTIENLITRHLTHQN